MDNKINMVKDILLKELTNLSETTKKGKELDEVIDKAKTISMVACQYVSADVQQMRREMLQNKMDVKTISYDN